MNKLRANIQCITSAEELYLSLQTDEKGDAAIALDHKALRELDNGTSKSSHIDLAVG
jgi:hypothetical protein